jgi:hypothetical protein
MVRTYILGYAGFEACTAYKCIKQVLILLLYNVFRLYASCALLNTSIGLSIVPWRCSKMDEQRGKIYEQRGEIWTRGGEISSVFR